MTTLSKDEIIAWAREAQQQATTAQERTSFLDADLFHTKFATLCRADLVADWNKQVSIALSLEKERDALRAENERLKAAMDKYSESELLVQALEQNTAVGQVCAKLEKENDDLRAEVERLRTALENYANENNWDDDFHGTKRKWLEPDSSTRNSYAGFEIARAALKGEA